jgi:hypothetical protein
MIAQLKLITDKAAYNLAKTILVDMALYQALVGKITWVRENENVLAGTASVNLPGEEPVEVKALLIHSCTEFSDSYYFHLEDAHGPCRNDADRNVISLVRMLIGEGACAGR